VKNIETESGANAFPEHLNVDVYIRSIVRRWLRLLKASSARRVLAGRC